MEPSIKAWSKSGNWDNRTMVKGDFGRTWLTVPFFKKKRSSQLVNEAQIDYSKNWREKHINILKNDEIVVQFLFDFFCDIDSDFLSIFIRDNK